MKWNEKTKTEAIDLLKKSVSCDEIAKIVGMSKASVTLLKAQSINDYSERVVCQICSQKLKQITHRHLKNHDMSFEDYISKFPGVKTCTDEKTKLSKNFEHPNKGKTYMEIYGEDESIKKKKKISEKQIGRASPKFAGTGISGTRKDTGMFARSTYEANVDRIFQFENKKIIGEFDENNSREELISIDGEIISYQPDRVDVDGLFEKGAYLEIKGYMFPEDWKKICLFRQQYPHKKLLVVSNDQCYLDISYKELKLKYSNQIPLWEGERQNYKTRPDLYKVGYIEPEEIARIRKMYPDNIHVNITNLHERFIAQKCINFNKVSKGAIVNIKSVRLLAMSDKRKGASRKSSGEYNYEMWEIVTDCGNIFYVGNIEKTTLFYCYESDIKLKDFFEDNCNMGLSCGKKHCQTYELISDDVLNHSTRIELLKTLNSALLHKGIKNKVVKFIMIESQTSKNMALNNYETWEVTFDDNSILYYSNFNNPTNVYHIRKTL